MRAPTRRRLRTRCGCTSGCGCRTSVRAEHEQEQDADREAGDGAHRQPAVLRRTDQRPDDRDRAQGRGEGADDVEATRTTRGLGDEATGQGQDGEADRDVDEQRPAPRAEVGDDAAEQQADRRAGRGDGTEERQRAVAGGLVGRAGGEEGEHAGCGHRRPGALQGPGQDQLGRGLRETAEQREEGEHAQPDLEHPEPAADVAEPAAEQQQAAERERVGVEHPRERRRPEAEVGVDPGQGDVHDGGVQHEHQLGHQHDRDPGRGAAGVGRELAGKVLRGAGGESGVLGGRHETDPVLARRAGPRYSVAEKFSAWRTQYGDMSPFGK